MFISYCLFFKNSGIHSSNRKKSFGTHRRRWKGNIKMDLRAKERTCLIHLVQENGQWRAVVHIAMKFFASENAENFLIT